MCSTEVPQRSPEGVLKNVSFRRLSSECVDRQKDVDSVGVILRCNVIWRYMYWTWELV